MKVLVDIDKCEGHLCCVMEADDVFGVASDGRVAVLNPTPGDDRRQAVEAAVFGCPVAAIRIEEGQPSIS